MGKIQLNQLEKADILPFKIGHRKQIKTNGQMWRIYNHYFHPEDNPYKIRDRIVKNNIGKSFALAFSYYCKKVEQRYQYEFLELFNYKGWRWVIPDYYIDENGLIQTNIKPKERKPIIIYSDDYKTELRHKVTGDKKEDFFKVFIDKKSIGKYGIHKGKIFMRSVFSHLEYGANPDKVLPLYLRYKAKESDFESVIISGYKQVFESRNDPRYVRITAERDKRLKIQHKLEKFKRWKISEQDFRRLLKEKELKEKQLNLIKIESHGFDPLTSFRKLKTN